MHIIIDVAEVVNKLVNIKRTLLLKLQVSTMFFCLVWMYREFLTYLLNLPLQTFVLILQNFDVISRGMSMFPSYCEGKATQLSFLLKKTATGLYAFPLIHFLT